jgi:hypothetical protein
MEIVPVELLVTWPVLVAVLAVADRRHGRLPLFLCNSYIAAMAINHWFGALVHAVPWNPFQSSANTILGFEATTWGLLFFVLGVALTPNTVSDASLAHSSSPPTFEPKAGGDAAKAMLLIGLAAWLVFVTPLASLPSITSVVEGGKQVLVVGICLKCWLSWWSGRFVSLMRWIGVGAFFPLYTTIFEGFLGFGISIFMTILIFVGTFYRPRWQVFLGAIFAVLCGLSVWTGYAQHRGEIRVAVWGGQSLEARLEAFGSMFQSLGPFDLSNPDHLLAVDGRLNQNELVGAVINYVPTYKDFAHGDTFVAAIAALIPRALWPDKPQTGGGRGMVAQYTGIEFSSGTSIGMGPVIEYYINYGWTGLAVGFFLFGVILRRIDFYVSNNLMTGAWGGVAFWFPVGASMLQPIGSLVEISSSAAAAAIIGLIIRAYIDRHNRTNATSAKDRYSASH